MDSELQRLQRELDADPSNSELFRRYYRIAERYGLHLNDRTYREWFDDLVYSDERREQAVTALKSGDAQLVCGGILEVLKVQNWRGRVSYTTNICDITPADPNIRRNIQEALLESFHDHMKDVRDAAIRSYFRLDGEPEPALKVCQELIASQDNGLKYWAGQNLHHIPGEGAIATLVECLNHGDWGLHCSAARALQERGQEGLPAREALERCLQSDYWAERRDAARALGRLGAPASPSIPALLALFNDHTRDVREAAVTAIAAIRQGAELALPVLSQHLRDPEGMHGFAARSLGAILPVCEPEHHAEALEALAQHLHSAAWRMRLCAGQVFQRLGDLAADCRPQLLVALRDREPEVRDAVLEALYNQSPNMDDAAEVLLELVQVPERRYWSYRALGQTLGRCQNPAPVLAQVEQGLADQDFGIRMTVSRSLQSQPAPPESLLNLLGELLSDPQFSVRQATAETMGSFAEAALPWLPQLVCLWDDQYRDVRRAAILASVDLAQLQEPPQLPTDSLSSARVEAFLIFLETRYWRMNTIAVDILPLMLDLLPPHINILRRVVARFRDSDQHEALSQILEQVEAMVPDAA